MIKLQTIKLSQLQESKSNPRVPADFKSPEFKDLVASVKEKGVLVPILARPAGKGFEVIAGSRRRRAAIAAGLTEIPAQVQQMTDAEAREAQIVENLQRADVHPLQEGQAYRELLEKFKGDVKSLAVRVGKSENYVRGRLYLTDLISAFQGWYRSGKMSDAQAVMLARLRPSDQEDAKKDLSGRWSWKLRDMQELRAYISEKFDQPLKSQPWLASAAMLKLAGACVECKPIGSTTLFGEKPIEGRCTTMTCWRRKMSVYIKAKMAEDPSMVKIRRGYGSGDAAGVLSESNYTTLSTKKKEHCDKAVPGIVVEGNGMGSILWICTGTGCKKHGSRTASPVRKTEAEKARELKEKQAEEKKRLAEQKLVADSIAKVKWPLTGSQLDALFDLIIEEVGYSVTDIAEAHKFIEPSKKKNDYTHGQKAEKALRAAAAKLQPAEKARLIFELLVGHHSYLANDTAKILKKL